MNNSPYLGYHWLNYERGVLSAYQYCLVKSGKKHTQDWGADRVRVSSGG